MKILCVCLGNICRSPLAEGILKSKAEQHGLDWEIDSAGTSDWHTGEQPDPRSVLTAAKNGIDISAQRARQISSGDFEYFDMIIPMDDSNYRDLLEMTKPHLSRKIVPIQSFEANGISSIPDPYYNGKFQEVFDLLKQVADSLFQNLTGKMEGTREIQSQS